MTPARDIEPTDVKLRRLFETTVPFNKVLGLKVESLDPRAPKLRFDMKPELIGNPRRQILHGGVISAVLDLPAGLSGALAAGQLEDPDPPRGGFPNNRTIDLPVGYLRPGRGKFFIASARVVRLGNRVAVAHTEMTNDEGELIATGGAAYMVG